MIASPFQLLLLSNSRKPKEKFLAWAEDHIRAHFPTSGSLLFIPFASVTYPWDDYADLVRTTFRAYGISVNSLHEADDYRQAIRNTDGIIVGGGNTFNLLYHLTKLYLLPLIREVVNDGIPYLGWSAGSNVACPTIQTTNDMPVRDLPSLQSLNLVPFQLNVHYTDETLPHHGGESRSDRLIEFSTLHPSRLIIGLPEGSALQVRGGTVHLLGSNTAERFLAGQRQQPLQPGKYTFNRTDCFGAEGVN